MPTRSLPANPDLDQLKSLAKTLQRLARNGEAGAVELLSEFHPRFVGLAAGAPELGAVRRADVQLALARSYGFSSWPKLRAHVETINRLTRNPHRQPVGETVTDGPELVNEFLRLACLTYGADDPSRIERARVLLAEHPELATATIHTMAAVGEVSAARALLDADPRQARVEGGPHRWEPLLYLAYSRLDSTAPGHSTLEVARLLLDAGADPDAGFLWEGECVFTALTGAFGEGEGGRHVSPPHQHETELARLLLDAGADPNDSQALYNRTWSRDDRHLELLLDYGLGQGTRPVWPARLGLDHPTPQQLVEEQLRWAAEAGRTSRVRLLIPRVDDLDGLGTNHPLTEGHTALELAVLHGNTETAELLARAGARPVTLTPVEELRAACLRGDRAAVKAIAARHPGVVAQLRDGHPDLAGAAAGLGRLEALRLLAGLGFDLNPTGCRTPLHEAAWLGDLDLVRGLIELGADPNLIDPEHHSTPLGWARYARHTELAAYLASLTDEAGAEP